MNDVTPPELRYDDALLRRVLREVKVIAMVGASPNWVRPSNFAMKYLMGKGFKVIPINPGHAGREIWGQKVHASLKDVPGPIDMVDIFRSSEAAGQIVDEALAIAKEKGVKAIWMQLGVRNDAAAARAEKAGLTVIMNRCPKIEYGRLFGELSWSGVNSRIVSSKRQSHSP
jgi:predicted CoA-binding protein